MIEITKYYTHPDKTLTGNPLIEYFPYCSREELRQLMTFAYEFDASELQHDWELRMTYTQRLLDLYIPQDHQLDWAQRFIAFKNQNLRHRNPLRGSQALEFHERLEAIAQRKAVPKSSTPLMESPMCAVLIGTPGTGKSATTTALLKVMAPDLLWHKNHGAVYQLLSLHVEAPTNGSGKSLALVVFLALRNEARKTGLAFPFMNKTPDTKPALEAAIEELTKALNLGVLVLDELQHLYRGSSGMDKETMAFLTGVVNKLGVVVLMIGTWEASGLMTLEARASRRGTSPASGTFYRMQPGPDWDAMVKFLLQYQYTERPVEFTQPLSALLYEHCQGIQDILVKLLIIAQMEAISSGEEELTLTCIDRVAQEHLQFIGPTIRKLKGVAEETDPALWDVEPEDFTKYVQALNANLQMRCARARKRVVATNAATQKALQVAASIAATGSVSDGVAMTLAEGAVEKNPSRSVEDHVVGIIKATKPVGPKPTRSEKRKAEVDAQFEKLDDEDIRKIVYLATRGGTSVEDALDAQGFICHPMDELTI